MKTVQILILVLLCLAGTALPVLAERESPTLQERIPEELLKSNDGPIWTFTFENDLIGRGTDQNYTSGVRLTVFDPGVPPGRIGHFLDRVMPFFKINETTSRYISVGQNMFTPDDITMRRQDPDDRPWAAFLYGSAGLTTVSGNHIDRLEGTLGIVGPAALGRQTQEFVHDLVDTTDPAGWDNQLENEPGIILSWERRWPDTADFRAAGLYGALTPHTGIMLGNVYTLGKAGFTIRLSPEEHRWQDAPVRVHPAIPGSGYFTPTGNTPGWYLFAGAEGRAIARNIFLDGNTFEDSHCIDKFPLVADINAGIALTYGRARVSYTLNYRTKEFVGQDRADLFGAVSVGYRF